VSILHENRLSSGIIRTHSCDSKHGAVLRIKKMSVGRQAAIQIFNQFSGIWEVMQMLANFPAIHFWKKIIADYTEGKFYENLKIFPKPEAHENMVLKFTTKDR
jgi:predicted acetyltransferase